MKKIVKITEEELKKATEKGNVYLRVKGEGNPFFGYWSCYRKLSLTKHYEPNTMNKTKEKQDDNSGVCDNPECTTCSNAMGRKLTMNKTHTNWEGEIEKWCHMLARFSVIGFKQVKDGGEVKYFDDYIKHSIEVRNLKRLFASQLKEIQKEIENVDFIDWYATNPNRCWHNEDSPTLEQDREENLKHIQDHKDCILQILDSYISDNNK